jgi:hypothetical protein
MVARRAAAVPSSSTALSHTQPHLPPTKIAKTVHRFRVESESVHRFRDLGEGCWGAGNEAVGRSAGGGDESLEQARVLPCLGVPEHPQREAAGGVLDDLR